MSTHNIGFYKDLTKIIFELSSNIWVSLDEQSVLSLTRLNQERGFPIMGLVGNSTNKII